ncbi:cytochrome P450 [Dichotomocladium elegans]|nr:cytochrome P450 [Dichotomocladium elegans]
MKSLVTTTGAVTGLISLAIYLSSKSLNAASTETIPSPKGSVFYFGHLLSFKRDVMPVQMLTEWQKDLGPIMQIDMGVRRWVVITDPYLAHELMNIQGSITSGRPSYMFSHVYARNKGLLFANPNPLWKKTRAVVQQPMAPQNVKRMEEVLSEEADRALDYMIENSITTPEGVDISKPLQLAALNAALSLTVAKRLPSITDPDFDAILRSIEEGMGILANNLNAFLPIFSIFSYFLSKRKIERFVRETRGPIFRRLILQAIASGEDCLVKTMKERDEFDDEDIDVTLFPLWELVGTGVHNIASTLAWTLLILCTYPDVQQKLREEVDAFIQTNGRLPGYTDREHLPHLVSAQKEVMRFRPTMPFNVPHMATEDVVCRGYFIPKGTVIMANMLAMHSNPRVFTEPDKFDPDRFLSNQSTMAHSARCNIDNRDHYMFGWGRRVCPAAYLAEVQLFNMLVRVLSRSIIEPPLNSEGKPVMPDLNKMKDGGQIIFAADTTLRLTPRTDIAI